jgi:predicted N-acyltransferase
MTGAARAASVVTSVHAVGAAAWDRLVEGDLEGTPFLSHAFLAALEDTGCTGGARGWEPSHIVLREGEAVVGVAPAFVKHHSLGEFVYDFAWADAAERAGLPYYPKLVLAAPFSPVSGRRLFADPERDPEQRRIIRRSLLAAAVDFAIARGCAGVHMLFGASEDIDEARELGLFVRTGCQFHWRDADYGDFEGFLARFPSHRRNQIRRERRQVAAAGVTVTHHRGLAIADAWREPAFAFYGATVDRYVHGRRYLNEGFFARLWEPELRRYLQLTLAWRAGRIIGGALNLEHGARRFGRYWGALDEVPGLHFEVCAYAAIEDCLARGVRAFEAGAGGESHKLKRGFLPALTASAHALFDDRLHDAFAAFSAREATHVRNQAEALAHEVFAR